MSIADHRIGTREEWQAAREQLLEREKEDTRLGDELARQRRDCRGSRWTRSMFGKEAE